MERYDAIVIGAGPAGLSAAITLKIRNKSVLVIGNAGISAKVEKAHEINNYLGLPAIKGSDLAKQFTEHAKSLGVEIIEEQIHMVYSMDDYFSLEGRSNTAYEAKSLILATGVSFGKPYPGEEEFLGRGVSYCATCDAPLYKKKNVAIIGSGEKEEEEARFMAELAASVTYIPLYECTAKFPENVSVLKAKPLEIRGKMKADTLVLDQGEIKADGIFILRDNVSPAQLVPGLETAENHITVSRKMATNIPGCFACGDCTGTPYQYIKAAGEGNVAALSAVEYLAKLK